MCNIFYIEFYGAVFYHFTNIQQNSMCNIGNRVGKSPFWIFEYFNHILHFTDHAPLVCLQRLWNYPLVHTVFLDMEYKVCNCNTEELKKKYLNCKAFQIRLLGFFLKEKKEINIHWVGQKSLEIAEEAFDRGTLFKV